MLTIALAALLAQDFPKPGKEHDWLKQLEGEWDCAAEFYHGPEPMKMKATESARMSLNGFWLTTTFKGEFFGAPFEGRVVLGYSPYKKKYVGTWVDSMIPHLFASEGELDAAGKVLSMSVDAVHPETGQPVKERWVTEIAGPDKHTFTFYGPGPDGKEKKNGEIVYTRKK